MAVGYSHPVPLDKPDFISHFVDKYLHKASQFRDISSIKFDSDRPLSDQGQFIHHNYFSGKLSNCFHSISVFRMLVSSED